MGSQEQIIPPAGLYTLVAIQLAGAIISVVMILGLLIPLLIQLKNGEYFRRSLQVSQQRRRRGKRPYSTYNLYLVYLSLVDLGWSVPSIAAQWSDDKFYPRFYSMFRVSSSSNSSGGIPPPIEEILASSYVVANVWINAIIAYQILRILQASGRSQALAQPSLMRVNLQGGGTLFGAFILGVGLYYNFYTYGWDGPRPNSGPVVCALCFFPFFYVIGVTILVVWRRYIPSATNRPSVLDRAVRGLALYFFRISAVFFGIWGPTGVNVMLVQELPKVRENGFLVFATLILWALQPMITFCIALSKPDVNKYIKDLVTFKYLLGDCCKEKAASVGPIEITESFRVSGPNSANLSLSNSCVDLLGYTFCRDDGDGDDNYDDDGDAEQNVEIDDKESEERSTVKCEDVDPWRHPEEEIKFVLDVVSEDNESDSDGSSVTNDDDNCNDRDKDNDNPC